MHDVGQVLYLLLSKSKKIAPVQVVVIPIYRSDEQLNEITKKITPILDELRKKNISVLFDNKDTHKPGYKFNEHEVDKKAPFHFN